MNIDWRLTGEISVPLLTLLLGRYLDERFAKRPKLLTWFASSAAFSLTGPPAVTIHTHALVIRNAGRKTANNLRIGHHILPRDFTIFPTVNFSVQRNPNGSGEIVIPTLVSGEQITVSYLYFPPVLWNQIHAYTKCDEGGVDNITVLPTPQPPKWMIVLIAALSLLGCVALVYFLIMLIRYFV